MNNNFFILFFIAIISTANATDINNSFFNYFAKDICPSSTDDLIIHQTNNNSIMSELSKHTIYANVEKSLSQPPEWNLAKTRQTWSEHLLKNSTKVDSLSFALFIKTFRKAYIEKNDGNQNSDMITNHDINEAVDVCSEDIEPYIAKVRQLREENMMLELDLASEIIEFEKSFLPADFFDFIEVKGHKFTMTKRPRYTVKIDNMELPIRDVLEKGEQPTSAIKMKNIVKKHLSKEYSKLMVEYFLNTPTGNAYLSLFTKTAKIQTSSDLIDRTKYPETTYLDQIAAVTFLSTTSSPLEGHGLPLISSIKAKHAKNKLKKSNKNRRRDGKEIIQNLERELSIPFINKKLVHAKSLFAIKFKGVKTIKEKMAKNKESIQEQYENLKGVGKCVMYNNQLIRGAQILEDLKEKVKTSMENRCVENNVAGLSTTLNLNIGEYNGEHSNTKEPISSPNSTLIKDFSNEVQNENEVETKKQ